ncbi:hypothetical protein SEUCBS139899_001300 [Sporothrix eucalyptigena]
MAVKRVYFLAHGGTVQDLTGWVRNLPNNKVEGEVQGDETAIATMMQKLDRGPSSAKVVRLDKEDREVVEGDAEFQIRR